VRIVAEQIEAEQFLARISRTSREVDGDPTVLADLSAPHVDPEAGEVHVYRFTRADFEVFSHGASLLVVSETPFCPRSAQTDIAGVSRLPSGAGLGSQSVDRVRAFRQACRAAHRQRGSRNQTISRHAFRFGVQLMKLPASDWPARVQRIKSLGFSTIIRGLWAGEATTFSGKHYQVQDAPRGIGVEEHGAPAILIGGGGRKLLTVAGRHADIVGINPSIPEGWITAKTSLDPTPERLQEKIG
jgi:hypothetical protein